MMSLPVHLRKYFWEVEFEKIDLERNRAYVLQRILEYGDEEAVVWMWEQFKKAEIREALGHFRGLCRKSANYWATVLDVPREEVLCLKKPSSGEPKTIWPY